MAVVYRCDVCNKLVENDEDIIRIKFSGFPMKDGLSANFSDWVNSRLLCPECQKKLFNFAKIKLGEES